jgi:hypothetical protein
VTQEIDAQLELRVKSAIEVINRIIENDSIEEGLMQNIGLVDQFFVQALAGEINAAETAKNEERKDILIKLYNYIQELTTPPELKKVEELIGIVDDDEQMKVAVDGIEPELMEKVIAYLTSIISNYEEQTLKDDIENLDQIKETLAKLKLVFNELLRKSMQNKMS